MPERWLYVDEIAAHLGVNPNSIHKWITRKRMLAHKLGLLSRSPALEVDQWVKSALVASQPTVFTEFVSQFCANSGANSQEYSAPVVTLALDRTFRLGGIFAQSARYAAQRARRAGSKLPLIWCRIVMPPKAKWP